MYVGRIVAVGRTAGGANAALYRVSSRSFPNRSAAERSGSLIIVPRAGHEADLLKNPYIAYPCVRPAGAWAVVSNGTQTDPIAEKLEAGLPPRDALASVLLALDYEKDDYDTPRIAGVIPLEGERAWLAVVRRDGLEVREVPLEAGHAQYVATYEHCHLRSAQRVPLEADGAEEAAQAAIDGPGFRDLERPVVAAAALARGRGFELGMREAGGGDLGGSA